MSCFTEPKYRLASQMDFSLTASLTFDGLEQIFLILLVLMSSKYLLLGFHFKIVLDSQIFLFQSVGCGLYFHWGSTEHFSSKF